MLGNVDEVDERWSAEKLRLAIRTALLLSGLPSLEPKPLRFSEILRKVESLTGQKVYPNSLLRSLERLVEETLVSKSADENPPLYFLKIEPTREELHLLISKSSIALIGHIANLEILLRDGETACEPDAYGISPDLNEELKEFVAVECDSIRSRIHERFDTEAEILIARARAAGGSRLSDGEALSGIASMRAVWVAICALGDGLGTAILTREISDKYIPGWATLTKGWKVMGNLPQVFTSARDLLDLWAHEAKAAEPFLLKLPGSEGKAIRKEWAALLATRVSLTLLIR